MRLHFSDKFNLNHKKVVSGRIYLANNLSIDKIRKRLTTIQDFLQNNLTFEI